jgi:DNA-binding transcriptional ArsR family regulator
LASTTKTKAPAATIDLRMAKALSHPIRVQILTILHKRVASPNQIAQEIGEGLSQVSYHVKVLKEFECVELVRTEPRRGAVEHFYRAAARSFLTDNDWKSLPDAVRQSISAVIVQMVAQDALDALGAGTFDSREDRHLSRTPLILDEEGWSDIASLLANTLDRVLEIQVESSSRLAKNGEKGILSRVEILHFESPEPEPDQGVDRSDS